VLPVAVGEATKAIPYLDESLKTYRAVMRLGVVTDTLDRTGKVLRQGEYDTITKESLLETFARFTGTINQTPPMYSAIKQGGVPLYKLARRGEEVERAPRAIQIYDLMLDSFEPPFVAFTVKCSRGTYVRSLAGDMGDFLECGAHLSELQRISSGPFTTDTAISLELLRSLHEDGRVGDIVITPYHALSHLKSIELSLIGATKVFHGISPAVTDFSEQEAVSTIPGEKVRLTSKEKLLAVALISHHDAPHGAKTFRLLRVFA
jgi:tRNA pseudouridine55 synthase